MATMKETLNEIWSSLTAGKMVNRINCIYALTLTYLTIYLRHLYPISAIQEA